MKISFPIAIIIITTLAVIVGGGVSFYQYYWLPKEGVDNSLKPIACTQEAKVCPDGSIVVRTGPDCEFAECPAGDLSDKEFLCSNSGGHITTRTANFCKDIVDFPNTCLDEGYAFLYCPPEKVRSVKVCDCGLKKCFGNNGCVYEENIEVIFPNGGEKLIVQENYKIQWEQYKLEKWGDVATICLAAFDNVKNRIKAKEESSLCYAFDNENTLIAETTLSKNEYQWVVPKDIIERFKESPSFYKIVISIYDSLPSEGRSEWAGFINADWSDDYFTIVPQ